MCGLKRVSSTERLGSRVAWASAGCRSDRKAPTRACGLWSWMAVAKARKLQALDPRHPQAVPAQPMYLPHLGYCHHMSYTHPQNDREHAVRAPLPHSHRTSSFQDGIVRKDWLFGPFPAQAVRMALFPPPRSLCRSSTCRPGLSRRPDHVDEVRGRRAEPRGEGKPTGPFFCRRAFCYFSLPC